MSKFKHGDRLWVLQGAKSGLASIDSTTRYFADSGAWVKVEWGPDSDGDYYVDLESDPGYGFYVREQDLSVVGVTAEPVESTVEVTTPTVWVTVVNADYSPTFVVHASEIDALRYAVANSAIVKEIGYGEEFTP